MSLALPARGRLERIQWPTPMILAEGAAGDVEMLNRSLLNRRVLDWLDERFRDP